MSRWVTDDEGGAHIVDYTMIGPRWVFKCGAAVWGERAQTDDPRGVACAECVTAPSMTRRDDS